jgi:uncharacterized repeat protein (TIGR01451 family)
MMATLSRTTCWIVRTRFVALVLLVGLAKLQAAQTQILSGHVPLNTSALQSVDRLPGSTRLNLAVGLPLRNREALTNLLEQLYDPTSPVYHQWLTVGQFTERFGPTEKDYEAVATFLQSQGLTVTATFSNRTLIDVSGAVADIEKAFRVNLLVYPHPKETRTFYAPNVEPSLDLAVPILQISGLDDYQLPRPASLKLNPAQRRQDVTPQAGSGPDGAYMGVDFRAAYASGVGLNGAGQYVGLLQFDSYYASDITTYATMTGLTNIPLQNVLLDGKTGIPGANNLEVALDIEMALSMAPGLAGVIVYEGGNGNSILNRMAVDNIAKQLSASWTYPTDANTPQIFQQFAVQGQAYFNASGDSGAYSGTPSSPTDSPYITSVGGTTLSTRGPGQGWLSEKTWSWYNAGTGTGASSGGISTTWPIPTWQQGISMAGNHGSTTLRNIPDVAMVSDNVIVLYDNGTQGNVGGDSLASPLWAAFLALVNQQAALNSQPPIGFLNPAIYTIGKSVNFASNFHDIRTGNNTNASSPNNYFAVIGYDLCTGWGTPAGKTLINSLAPPANSKVVVGAGATLALETCTPTNGTINPGEPVIVNLNLQNIGAVNTANLTATLQGGADVQPISGPQTYGTLVGGGVAVSRSFIFIPSGTCGATISPTLHLEDGVSKMADVVFSFPLGAPLLAFNQSFDSVSAPALPVGWSRSVSGSVSNWITTASFRYSAPNAVSVVGSISPGVSDLVSPSVSITTTSAQLSFFNSYVTETTNSSTPFDGGMLEIKIGSGSFTDILAAGGSFVSGGYTGTLVADTGNPLPGRQVWGGTSGGFLATVINLPAAAAGQNIQLKWRLATDIENGAGATFWYLDNIAIADGRTCCTPVASADLAVSQSVLPDPGLVGQALAYSITVTNNGPGPAVGVNFTDVLPANATLLFASPGCVYSNGIVTSAIPLLVAGGKTNFTVLVLPTTEGSITNTLAIASSVSDPNPDNSTATAITTIYAAPAISIQPSNQVAAVGSDVGFSVLATGTAPLSYQWYLEGTNLLNGATESTLQLTNVQIWQAGNYGVVITNLFGSITSDPASLKVLVPPTITLTSLDVTATNVSISLLSVSGLNYTLEYKNSLTDASWSPLFPAMPGNGLVITLQDTNGALIPSHFYRVNCN